MRTSTDSKSVAAKDDDVLEIVRDLRKTEETVLSMMIHSSRAQWSEQARAR
jgi:hypothetical protein